MKQSQSLLLMLGVLIIGFGLGYIVDNATDLKPLTSSDSIEMRGAQGYTFINPLLECDIAPQYISEHTLADFKPELQSVIDKETSAGNITYAGVYFRDLNEGPWFGINSNDNFRPASLLKVPVLMDLLKMEEEHPGTLKNTVVYDGTSLNAIQDIPPTKHIEKDKRYTYEELLEYMIKYSDNDAAQLLLKHADTSRLTSLFTLLGFNVPQSDPLGQDNFVTLKEYAGFFRLLYNASYLSDDLSEKALKLLSETQFNDGLRAGVPSTVTVAHKFGENINTLTGETELHDCGIVYYPKKPYLLCISTRGTDYKKLESVIAEISRSTYAEVDRQVKGN